MPLSSHQPEVPVDLPLPENFSRDASVAVSAALAAGRVIRERFGSGGHQMKNDGTEVTPTDLEAEGIIRRYLLTCFPGDGFFGEEASPNEASPDKGRVWVVDPIDGTTWFTLGIPKFATLICLCVDGTPSLGVMYAALSGQMWFAERGCGTWQLLPNGRLFRCYVDKAPGRIRDSFVSASGIHGSEIACSLTDPVVQLNPLIESASKFRFLGDCFQHAALASGRIHVAVDSMMQPWDSAALLPILSESGASFCSLDGTAYSPFAPGGLVAASSRALLDEAIDLLRVPPSRL